MSKLFLKVATLPALDRQATLHPVYSCKICQGPVALFDRVDFNKYCSVENCYEFGLSGIDVRYYRCHTCGFLFTPDFDDWTQEQFAQAIYNADYIKVDGEYAGVRPRRTAADIARRLRGCEDARILDYGSGAGIFVEAMREHGFRDITGYDPFSNPERPAGKFDIITSFEVIEHTVDPIATLKDMRHFLRDDGCILFGQTVQPPDILERRGSWWYIAPRNGHVSTYTRETLILAGRQLGFSLHASPHLFGFATPSPSSYAAHALYHVGPHIEIVRLFAPPVRADDAITFPDPDTVVWHKVEDDGSRRFRRTGAGPLSWEASWPSTERLQVRLPVLPEDVEGLIASAEFELFGVKRKAELDAQELVAEFDVGRRVAGTLTLHMRVPPIAEGQSPDARGLAVPLDQPASVC